MRIYNKWNIGKDCSYSSLFDAILEVRGFTREELDVGSEVLHDPRLLKDMDLAVERVLRAIQNSEKIMVFGDYDVDGVSSTALMSNFLKDVGAEFFCGLPDRQKDGYGLKPPAVERALGLGADLIITVDNGISAFEGIEYANNNGIDIVVTDHHKQLGLLPEASAVVNPNRLDCSYPFKGLAGVGVAFKLVQVLSENFMSLDKRRIYLNNLLDLVALGTIADIVPVFGENRVLIRRGLQIMNNTGRLGLNQLKIVAGVSQKKITSSVVGYQLSPRINVAGRMHKPDTALELLCANTKEDACRLAENLNEQNLLRQNLQREAMEEADEQVTATILEENRILILLGEWKVGLIGIIAGRLRDKYLRPVIVCTSDCEEDYYVGSARSFAYYDISESIASCRENLNSYGGHTQAAGFSLPREHFTNFRQDLVNHAQQNISSEHLEAELNVDVQLKADDLCKKSIQVLSDLEPFGKGNELPIFAMFGCKILSYKLIGKNSDHCKLEIEVEGKKCAALCWNRGEIFKEIEIGQHVAVAFTLEEDSFKGREAVQMVVKDLFIESDE